MADKLQTLFFLGKGGTGKSTVAALSALALQDMNKKVLLSSFDEAHNQNDIFEKELSDKACTIGPCLEVNQIDRDRQIKKYLARTAREVKSSFTYLTAFNLDNYFDILKYSPGMEEYALVTALTDLQSRYADYDYLIIDMPPTALSLRFFALPSLSLTWIEQLEKLRQKIKDHKEIVSKIKLGGKTIEKDKVLNRMHEIKSGYQELNRQFRDPVQTLFFVVLNPDILSGAETERIQTQLGKHGITINGLIYNHRQALSPENSVPGSPQPLPVCTVPYSPSPLVGQDALYRHIQSNTPVFDRLMALIRRD